MGAGGASRSAQAPSSNINTAQANEVGALMERRREFEENFTRTIRDLRKELEEVCGVLRLPESCCFLNALLATCRLWSPIGERLKSNAEINHPC